MTLHLTCCHTCVLQSTGEVEVTCPCHVQDGVVSVTVLSAPRPSQVRALLACRPQSEALSDAGALGCLADPGSFSPHTCTEAHAWHLLTVSGICGDPPSGWEGTPGPGRENRVAGVGPGP